MTARKTPSTKNKKDAVLNALRESGKTYRSIFENTSVPTILIEKDSTISLSNSTFAALSGYRRNDIDGKKRWMEFVAPDGIERLAKSFNDLIATKDGSPRNYSIDFLDRKKTIHRISLSVTVIPRTSRIIASFTQTDDEKGVEGGSAYDNLPRADVIDTPPDATTAVDLTGLTQQEMSPPDTEANFRTIIETTASAIAILEEDSTISYINPEFERIIGYVREEVEGRKKWTDFVAPPDLERMKEYEQKRRTEVKIVPANYEFRFIRFDGEARNGFCTITPVPDSGKMIVSLTDITDKIKEEDALQRAIKKLNFLNSITRHEILNHLTVVKGFIELSKDQLQNPGFLMRSFDREIAAANAIQNLMVFTRDYQNIGIQPPEWYAVSKKIKSAVAGIRLGSIALSDDTEGVEIYADQMIEKVFFHFVDNAVKYGGKIRTIRFFCEESFEELHLICEDDGIGIPSDAKEKIFNRQFFQNTGLDMYLCREIVSITGMSLHETGTYGIGSRFEIHIPKGAYRFTNSR
ncbi:MAG: PAS domain S-box protein [Methanoregula sp.]|nr:PAS domain S-box protein [Methanoregula sp.]